MNVLPTVDWFFVFFPPVKLVKILDDQGVTAEY